MLTFGIFYAQDYVAAATRGAQAAVLGNIPPMNPADEPESHMFIWNNMFLSFATNSRGIFSALGGEEGAHVAANNDLKGVRLFSSIPECPLYTLATVVVDYMGRRVIAQSMIPGILRKDQTNTIVYGIYGNFDIVEDHSSRGSQLCATPTRAVCYTLLRGCACWMLIGACDPMSFPIHV